MNLTYFFICFTVLFAAEFVNTSTIGRKISKTLHREMKRDVDQHNVKDVTLEEDDTPFLRINSVPAFDDETDFADNSADYHQEFERDVNQYNVKDVTLEDVTLEEDDKPFLRIDSVPVLDGVEYHQRSKRNVNQLITKDVTLEEDDKPFLRINSVPDFDDGKRPKTRHKDNLSSSDDANLDSPAINKPIESGHDGASMKSYA